MMLRKFKFVICTATFGLIHFNSFAFDLQAAACKTVAGWTPLFGKCNEQGQLSGSGGAFFGKRLIVKGLFKEGLPDGKGEFSLVRDALLTSGSLKYLEKFASADIQSWDAFIRSSSKKDSYFEVLARTNFCSISFDAGQIANGDIKCTVKLQGPGPTGELAYSIKPLAGKSYLRNGQIEMDIPTVSVRATLTNSMYGVTNSLVITGVSDELILSDTETLHMRGLVGSAIYATDARSDATEDYAVGLQSYLDVSCIGGNSSCLASHMPFTPQGSNVDAKYLTKVTLKSGKTIQYVALTSNRLSLDSMSRGAGGRHLIPLNFPSMGNYMRPSDNRFYYFKASNGVEFDGSAPECNGKGQAKVKGDNWKVLDFFPVCGKVTMPDGRTYSGSFDDQGKPLR
jgi:hypothetical protein